jgi:hypothetical protein
VQGVRTLPDHESKSRLLKEVKTFFSDENREDKVFYEGIIAEDQARRRRCWKDFVIPVMPFMWFPTVKSFLLVKTWEWKKRKWETICVITFQNTSVSLGYRVYGMFKTCLSNATTFQ